MDNNVYKIIRDIGLWHVETFGQDCAMKRVRRKLLEEAAEVMCAKNKDQLREELADVVMVAFALAHREGVDLPEAIEEKFLVVKERAKSADWVAS